MPGRVEIFAFVSTLILLFTVMWWGWKLLVFIVATLALSVIFSMLLAFLRREVVVSATIFWMLSGQNPFKKATILDFSRAYLHFRGAIGEELFSRGYPLQTLIGGIGPYPAIAVTSAFFGFLHYQSLRQLGIHWTGVIYLSLSGALLAIAVLKVKALWLAVGWHFSYNLLEAAFCLRDKELQDIRKRYLATLVTTVVLLIVLIWLPIQPHPEMERLWNEYILRP